MIHNKIGDLVVKPRISPGRKLIIVGVGVVVLFGGSFAIYNRGLHMAGFDRSLDAHEFQALHDANTRLRTENQDLRENLARVQRTLQDRKSVV